MTQLMGQNMMRKDGVDHQRERHAIFPTVSPKTVRSCLAGRIHPPNPMIFWTALVGQSAI